MQVAEVCEAKDGTHPETMGVEADLGNWATGARSGMSRTRHAGDAPGVRRYTPSMNLTQLLPPSNVFSIWKWYRSSPWNR